MCYFLIFAHDLHHNEDLAKSWVMNPTPEKQNTIVKFIRHHFYWVCKVESRVMWACTFAHWCVCATHHCLCVCWAFFKGHAFVQAQMMQLAETWLLLEARPCWHTYRKPWLLGHTLYRLHKGCLPSAVWPIDNRSKVQTLNNRASLTLSNFSKCGD